MGVEIIDGKQIEKPLKIEKNTRSTGFTDIINYLYIWSEPYAIFATGINRAISNYSDIINIKKKEDYFDFKNLSKIHSTYVFLVNAMEVYLRQTFYRIAGEEFVKDLNYKKLIKLLKKSNLERQFLEFKREKKSLNFLLTEFLCKLSKGERARITFQQPETIKLAYSSIGLNVVSMINGLWQRIIDDELKWRHYIIHKDLNELIDHIKIEKFNLDDEVENLERCVLDIVQFIFYIESQRLLKYPDELEMNGILSFPEENIDPKFKKNIIRINRTHFLRIISILEQGRFDDDAQSLKNMLKS